MHALQVYGSLPHWHHHTPSYTAHLTGDASSLLHPPALILEVLYQTFKSLSHQSYSSCLSWHWLFTERFSEFCEQGSLFCFLFCKPVTVMMVRLTCTFTVTLGGMQSPLWSTQQSIHATLSIAENKHSSHNLHCAQTQANSNIPCREWPNPGLQAISHDWFTANSCAGANTLHWYKTHIDMCCAHQARHELFMKTARENHTPDIVVNFIVWVIYSDGLQQHLSQLSVFQHERVETKLSAQF